MKITNHALAFGTIRETAGGRFAYRDWDTGRAKYAATAEKAFTEGPLQSFREAHGNTRPERVALWHFMFQKAHDIAQCQVAHGLIRPTVEGFTLHCTHKAFIGVHSGAAAATVYLFEDDEARALFDALTCAYARASNMQFEGPDGAAKWLGDTLDALDALDDAYKLGQIPEAVHRPLLKEALMGIEHTVWTFAGYSGLLELEEAAKEALAYCKAYGATL